MQAIVVLVFTGRNGVMHGKPRIVQLVMNQIIDIVITYRERMGAAAELRYFNLFKQIKWAFHGLRSHL